MGIHFEFHFMLLIVHGENPFWCSALLWGKRWSVVGKRRTQVSRAPMKS